MPPTNFHRKRVRHFENRSEIHELTFSCYHRLPLLDDNWRREQLSIAIDRALRNQNWKLAAFVYMPEHVHLLVMATSLDARISDLLFGIKRPFSYRVKQNLVRHKDSLVNQLTDHQRPGKTTFRFWQEGPGYDRNIRSESALRSSIDYIHNNPVRRGLADTTTDYRWSSAKWYATDGKITDSLLPPLSAVPPDWFAGVSDATSY